MSFDEHFAALWRQHEFDVPQVTDDRCVYAKHFAEWASQIIANVEQIATVVAVNQGVLRVTYKYFEWRTVVPKYHRNRIGEMGHTCIFHVFEAAFLKLRIIELAIQPPPILPPTLPPPPPTPPPPPAPLQIAGIFLGDDES
jgi:hypothetical protein